MSREVRFGREGDGDPTAAQTSFSLVETETATGEAYPFSFLEPEPDSETISRLLNTEVIAAAEKELHRQKRLAAFWSKVQGVIIAAALLMLAASICLIMVYLNLHPVAPNFEVLGAGFVSVSIVPLTALQLAAQQAAGNGNYFAAYFTFNSSYTVLFGNHNKKVDVFVEELELTVYYEGFRMGSITKRDFVQHRSSSQVFKMFIAESHLPVPLKVYYTMFLVVGKKNYFGADLVMKGRMSTVRGLISPPFMFRVRCTLVLKSYVVIGRTCYRRNTV